MPKEYDLKRMVVIAREYPYIHGLADVWLGLMFTGLGSWALGLGWS